MENSFPFKAEGDLNQKIDGARFLLAAEASIEA